MSDPQCAEVGPLPLGESEMKLLPIADDGTRSDRVMLDPDFA